MLTTREGGAAASALRRAEDVGVNDLGDGGAAMRALRRNQHHGMRKQAAPLALVWFWRIDEDRTEETRQTVKAAGVLYSLN